MKFKLLLIILCFCASFSLNLAQDVGSTPLNGELFTWSGDTNGKYIILVTADDVECRDNTCERQLLVVDLQEEQTLYSLDYTGYTTFSLGSAGDRFAMVRTDNTAGETSIDTVEFHAIEDGRLISEWQLPIPDVTPDDYGETVTTYISFSDDLSLFYRQTTSLPDNFSYGYRNEISVWSSENGELLFEQTCEDEGIILGAPGQRLLSPDGKYLMYGCIDSSAGADLVGTMGILQISTGTVIQQIPRYVQNAVVDWAANSSYILIRGGGFVRVFDLKQEVGRIPIENFVQLENLFSSDSAYFYLVNSEETALHLMDLSDGTTQVLSASKFGGDTIKSVQFSPDSTSLFIAISSSRNETMKLILLDLESRTVAQSLDFDELYSSGITTLLTLGELWRNDERYLSICEGSNDDVINERSLFVWDLENNSVATLPGPVTDSAVFCSVDYSLDGRYVSYFRQYYDESSGFATIQIMELAGQEIVYDMMLEFDGYLYTAMGWHEDDNRFMFIDPVAQSINFVTFNE